MSGNEIEIKVDVDKVNADPLEAAFKRIIDSGQKMGSGVGQGSDRARDALGRLVKTSNDSGDAVQTATGFFGNLRSKLMDLMPSADDAKSALASLGGGMAYLSYAVIPAVAAGLLALGPALLAVGGIAGAATTAIAGMGVAFATLEIGLGGVGDAWTAYTQQAKTGGGSSAAAGQAAAAAAEAVKNAEYSLTQAKLAATQASKDLTKAREDERLRLINLSLSLRSQRFAEADAAKSVREAEDKLNAARAYGVDSAIKDAQDQLDRAKLAYDVEHEKMNELNADQKKTAKDGVEGSDQVTAAKKRQSDANHQVAMAVQSLADAQRAAATSAGGAAGGVNAFNEAMKKLSPNAQAFVREMISLSERFKVIKMQVQDKLFAGLDVTLENLAQKWLPKLGPMLGGMADSLNKVARGIAGALGNPDFMKGMQTASKAFSEFLTSDLSPAIDHVIHAFGELAGGSTEPFKIIGGWIKDIAEKFDKWITSASKSGQLKTFMHEAADTLKTIWDIGKKALGIVGQFIAILFPGSKKKGGSTLDAIDEALGNISNWLKDPKNQKQIKAIEDGIFQWADAFGEVIGMVNDLRGLIIPVLKLIQGVIWLQLVPLKLLKGVWDMIIISIKWIGKHGPGMWDGIKNAFRSAMNWIIDRWNSLQFTLPSINIFGNEIGGGTIGTSHINHMASGGAGGGMAWVGENGPERVRLPYGSSVMTAGDSARARQTGGQGVSGTLRLSVDGSTERGLIRELLRLLRVEIATYHSGNVQRALGQGAAA